MALWSTLTHRVLLEAPRCSIPLAEEAVRDATIELCEAAQPYIYTLPEVDVVADTATYALTSDVAETEIAMVRSVWYDGTKLDYAPLDALNATQEWWTTESDTPTAFTMYNPSSITLYPIPTSALTDGLRVEVALRPTSSATGVVDWIATKYSEEIAWGAKARIMAVPDMPFSNPQRALYYGQLFQRAKGLALADTNRSHTRGTLTVRPRPAVR